MSFAPVKPDGEPTVTATLATADDVACPAVARYGSVNLMAFTKETRDVLAKFDRNGDGEVDEGELEGVIDVLVKEQFKGRLTWAVVSLQKEMTVRDGVLVQKRTQQPLQLGDSRLTVDPARRLVTRGLHTVATATLYLRRPLNANMTSKMLNSLARVSINGVNGIQVGFRVTGFALMSDRIPPELHISTPGGVLVVAGETLAGHGAAAGLVEAKELEGQAVIGVFTS